MDEIIARKLSLSKPPFKALRRMSDWRNLRSVELPTCPKISRAQVENVTHIY